MAITRSAPHVNSCDIDSAAAAFDTYEAVAHVYDDFTASYQYDHWLEKLERLALDNGLSGRRTLDVACGTGKSFAPLLERGYDITACDVSPRMLALARKRLGGDPSRAFVADMRELPALDGFDLVTCLDDAVNYLLEEGDLLRALASMRRALRPGGVLLFDVNSLRTYRTTFAQDSIEERDSRLFCWRGHASSEAAPGELHRATLEVFSRVADHRWERSSGHHLQRHHPLSAVRRCIARAGLTLLSVRGQFPGAILDDEPDEERHSKLLFLASRKEER